MCIDSDGSRILLCVKGRTPPVWHITDELRRVTETAEWSGQPLQLTSALPCVTEGEDQLVLGDDKGSKNSTHAAPLVSQVVGCMFVCGGGGCMSVRGGGGTWTDITVSSPAPQYIYWDWRWHQFKVRPNLPRYPGFCLIQLFTARDQISSSNK